MKKIFIIRHAKSDQSFFGNDFERPLNERGKTDAPVMAKRLLHRKIKIDALISSPAKRARKTAEIFAENFKIPAEEIIFVSELYHAPAETFYKVISDIPDNLHVVVLFAHNPGITSFVNSLNTGVNTDNMPTCAIYAVETDILKWSDFSGAKKEFLMFDYPKAGK